MSFSEWKEKALGEFCKYPSERILVKDLKLNNYISTENMLKDRAGVVEANKLPTTKTVIRYDIGDILISNIRPYFKKIWYASNSGGSSSDVLVIKNIEDNQLDNKYLYYYLCRDDFFNYVMGSAKGTKMPRGDKNAIMKYPINVPPLNEQKAIANILSTLDEKIEINNQINKNLEEMAQAIFRRWFVDFEFPNNEGKPYKSSGGEMVESELGLIPKGWKVKTLGDIIEIASGKRPKKKTKELKKEFNIPLVGASSIMGYVKEFNYNEPIIIIGRVGTHGVIQRFNYKIWASDNTLVIKSMYYEYVYQFLNLIDYKSLNRGSTQPLITQTDIKNQKITMPVHKTLNDFEFKNQKIYKMISKNNVENFKLEKIRDTLLPKLMSGEIRVPLESENDAL